MPESPYNAEMFEDVRFGIDDRLVPLAREASFDFVSELLEQLEQQHVPYVIQAGTALEFLDGDRSATATAQPWEARIWVAQSAEATATSIFAELDANRVTERANQITRRYADAGRWYPPDDEA